MSSFKKAYAVIASAGLAASMLALAPAASADNYAPELPSNTVKSLQRIPLSLNGAQPGCRVTFTVRNTGGAPKAKRKLIRLTRTGVDASGNAKARFRAPYYPGIYQLITRVDNFKGTTGCAPTKSIQRIRVNSR